MRESRIPIVVLAVDLFTALGQVMFQVPQIRRLLDLAGHWQGRNRGRQSSCAAADRMQWTGWRSLRSRRLTSLKEPDSVFRDLLAATNRGTSRTRYVDLLKALKR